MSASSSSRTALSGLYRSVASSSSRSVATRCFSSSTCRRANGDSAASSSASTSGPSSSNTSSAASSSLSSTSSASQLPTSKASQSSGVAASRSVPTSSPMLDKPMPLSFPSDTLRAFPSLLHFADPVLDPHPSNVVHSKPTSSTPYPSTVTLLNEPQHFEPTPPSAGSLVLSSGSDADEVNSEQYLSTVTPLTTKEVRDLHRHAIVLNRVVHMTTKGKDASMYALVVAGNGNGLVGYGEGKDTNASKAGRKAFHEAVKNLDSVSIHKGSDGSRTIETQVEAKWGASRVVLRPRPAGFGLRVPPVIHAICRSSGITDLSASIYGSTNPINVVKAALQILWGGSAPLGMGDGVGGQMRRKDKGRGMRGRVDIERSRGRRIAEVEMRK
ncbi:hypothetical protein BCV70DRAFT_198612 [Testicularia cyperi]|uniref:Small ribosomal subunit protein uS5m n=1 Tax=Testicularia cyperi TaxID=1882483 RepID=A0A317XWQ8_9BASI|nr:hypothetical protein BCV70DRAFT_198612 [Testicularia cyperi]